MPRLKGYWQVPLSEWAKEVSVFVTPDTLNCFKFFPFGMKNAPATFQWLMNPITAGLSNVATVYSASWSEQLEDLQCLFQRLHEAWLVINLSKCEMEKGQVTYLGHEVGQGKVIHSQAKVRAILDLPSPQTHRELMQVLGMCHDSVPWVWYW